MQNNMEVTYGYNLSHTIRTTLETMHSNGLKPTTGSIAKTILRNHNIEMNSHQYKCFKERLRISINRMIKGGLIEFKSEISEKKTFYRIYIPNFK